MPTVNVYNMEGKVTGSMELNESIFAVDVNSAVVHSVVRAYLMNQRQGTQSTLTRAEVSGGGRKPWKQKGTGRARQGSTRSPQWVHGGIALGPKPRKYKVTINKKEKRIAMLSALTSKVLASELIVVDNIALDEFKTKKIVAMLSALGVDRKAMIITEKADLKVIKSASNIKNVMTAPVNAISVYDILKYDKMIITKEAITKIEEVYA